MGIGKALKKLGSAVPVIGPAALQFAAPLMEYYGGKEAREADRQSAQTQMEFQERMSSTAYQRATDDMRKAGLNPMLAYSQGGASSPGGAGYDAENLLSPIVSSAMGIAQMKSSLKEAATRMDMNKASKELMEAQETVAETTAKNNKRQGRLMDYQMPGAEKEAEIEKTKGIIWKDILDLFGQGYNSGYDRSKKNHNDFDWDPSLFKSEKRR